MGITSLTLDKEPSSYVLNIRVAGTNQRLGSKIINGCWVKNPEDLNKFPDKEQILLKYFGKVYRDENNNDIMGKEVRFRKGKREHDMGKFTIASDLNKFGFDRGEYSIEMNRCRILNLLVKSCDEFFDLTKNDPKAIFKINLRGYSRGGVAVALAQSDFYKEYLSKLSEVDREKIQLYVTLIDPVPGPAQPKKCNEINIDKSAVKRSVIIYSTNSRMTKKTYFEFFTPQAVYGTDIIIVTDRGHCCGQEETTNFNKKIKFIYNEQEYDYGQLINLPNGFYFNSESENGGRLLVNLKKDDFIQFKKRVDEANISKFFRESKRAKRLISIFKKYFNIHSDGLTGSIS